MKEPYYLVECTHCGWEGNNQELDGVKPVNATSSTDWIDVCPDCMQAKYLVKV